jgi:DNA modification methylase
MLDWINKTHVGDCHDLLAHMVAEGVRVQTCVTSPPYYGLRDYGTATWEGGKARCDHREKRGGDGAKSAKQTTSGGTQHYQYRLTCGKCGARRVDRQIGLEPTASEYVNKLVSVFRLVRNLLTPDGTLWLNLGDSYAGYHGNKNSHIPTSATNGWTHGTNKNLRTSTANRNGIKTKDLLGIPWRVALALQADGWYLRSDIIEEVELYCPCGCGYLLEERIWRWSQDREFIWRKPNAVPESVCDRPTRAHEYLFLLSKQPRYYYDAKSIAEPAVARVPGEMDGGAQRGRDGSPANAPRNYRKQEHQGRRHVGFNERYFGHPAPFTRNRRSVWTIATTPFRGSHFATFPRKLIEPCIAAGSRPGDVVLDPFSGTGTTRHVAIDLGRHYIGCELNPAYIELEKLRHGRTERLP